MRATRLPGPLTMAVARDLGETDAFDAGTTRAAARPAGARSSAARSRSCARRAPTRIEITGDVPRGGGLSSSAALGCALALALCGEDDPDRRALARLASRVENEWVGARTGLLDQYASLLALGGTRAAHRLRGRHGRAGPARPRRLAARGRPGRDRATSPSGGYNDVPRRARHPEHLEAENERVRERSRAAARTRSARCWTPRTPPCATTSGSPPTASRRVRDGLKAAGAAGARLIGGGFGGHVLALFAPGAPATPRGAGGAPEPRRLHPEHAVADVRQRRVGARVERERQRRRRVSSGSITPSSHRRAVAK